MKLQFDARTVAPQEAFEILPAGWYMAEIEKTEEKDTTDGLGKYLEFTLKILAGDYVGRKVFDRLNLVNKSQQAVDIAYQTLSSICHATGRLVVGESHELHGGQLCVKVSVQAARTVNPGTPAEKTYEAKNEVKGYKVLDPNKPEFGPSKNKQGPAPAQQQAAPAWAGQMPATPAAATAAWQPVQPQVQQPVQQAQPPAQQWQQPQGGNNAQPPAAAPPAWAQPQQAQPPAQPPAQMAPPAQPQPPAPPAAGSPPPWATGGQPGAQAGGPPPWQAQQPQG